MRSFQQTNCGKTRETMPALAITVAIFAVAFFAIAIIAVVLALANTAVAPAPAYVSVG